MQAPDRSFSDILDLVNQLGQETISSAASDVDQKARFPEETFGELKAHRLLSTYVPRELGGDGLNIQQIARICEELGHYCASSAMIYAMHQIQVACLVHHHNNTDYFQGYLKRLSAEQLLLASATTEIGTGGDLGKSVCSLEPDTDGFELCKKAPVISYGLEADGILITCRKHPEAASNDQVQVLLEKGQYELKQISDWDTLGFRGTVSSGFIMSSKGSEAQVQPTPFSEILEQTMHPVSHLLWGSLWLGIANDSVRVARNAVRDMSKSNMEVPQVTAIRLSEVNEQLFSMRNGLYKVLDDYQGRIVDGKVASGTFAFASAVNNVKLRCSEMVVDIVGQSLMIVGISGYRNRGEKSLSRHLRDAYGAALMVNNDRIRQHNAMLQMTLKQ
ncbi:acyl-CoA dehydrogenase family protein [Porticoccus sp. GXU_MW_L64]